MSREQKSVDDQAKILEKVRAKIQEEIEAQHRTQDDEDEEFALLAENKQDGEEELKELVKKLRDEKLLIEQAHAEEKKD